MQVNTNSLVSISEANQNFSKVARLVDENGVAVILKNNRPRYIVLEYSQLLEEQVAADTSVLEIGQGIVKRNRKAFQELAK